MCGKFVYDSSAGTLRLPKVSKGFLESTIDSSAIGDLVEAGLPNITGTIFIPDVNGGKKYASGVFSGTDGTSGTAGGGWNGPGINYTFNAAKYNAVYGRSATVQPQSLKCFVYMVLANTVKTPV